MAIHSETDIAPALLAWYDRHARTLPWRAPPGRVADPYHVWLSEVMLQQTTVATVGDYFRRFLARWPTVGDLAAAELDDVLTEWAGLGYYARARNLHKCAIQVATEFDGRFPDTEEALRELPGIGRYTAAAIAAIAFDRPAAVMDGNIERVTTRLYSIETPLPDSKPALYAHVEAMTPARRPGDFAQAMMDLGATVCTPGRPKCMLCPLTDCCDGRPIAETLPRKKPKKAKPTRRGAAFWIERGDGAILLRRRPEKGLLGGMMEFPGTDWTETGSEALDDTGLPAMATVTGTAGSIRHTFTHFHLELLVFRARAIDEAAPDNCTWCLPEALGDRALPTVMRKVAKAALSS
ncbi:MAG: A/G-specific adenine glycosylase [Pseudomonadota bacterium]|nr:A/G-specific adenine glycosylase [Pseudomonadota bacterium]